MTIGGIVISGAIIFGSMSVMGERLMAIQNQWEEEEKEQAKGGKVVPL